MSKFIKFILFNVFMYFSYFIIDKIFTFFDWFSNPELGYDIMIVPTSNDVWLIVINSLISSGVAFYLLFKIKKMDIE